MLGQLRQEDGCEFLTLTSLGYKFQASLSYRERHCLKKRRKKEKNLRSSPPDVRACSFDTQLLLSYFPRLSLHPLFSFYSSSSCFFDTKSCCAALAFLVFVMYPKLALNLQQASCLSLLSMGIMVMHQQAWILPFLKVQTTTFIAILKYFGGKGSCFHSHKGLSLDPSDLDVVLSVAPALQRVETRGFVRSSFSLAEKHACA